MPLKTTGEIRKEEKATAPPGVDEAVGVPGARWYVAIVSPRQEKAVARKLLDINVEAYVATQEEMHLWANGRRRKVERVVIPSMVFVHCTERERRQIVTLPYIRRFLVNRSAESGGLNKPVAVIRDSEIEKLRFMLGQGESRVEFASGIFRVHDTVRVIRGSLRGLAGEIRESGEGSHSLLVSLSLLGGALVRIDPRDVEKLP